LPLCCDVQTSSEAHQPPVQWILGFFHLGCSGQTVKLTTYLHLMSRLRVCEAIFPLPHTSAWHGA
jgi:hypothetical protein